MILDNTFNPGAFRNRYDSRDLQWAPLAAAMGVEETFDWEKGFDSEAELGTKVIIENQNGSSSCTGQATSSYGDLLNYVETSKWENFSAKWIYEQVFLPEGGAYVRDALNIPVNYGFALEKDLPSYENGAPPSEGYMREPLITTPIRDSAKRYQPLRYYALPGNDIDAVAIAIKNHWGVMLAATGSNEGWRTADVRSPLDTERKWGHAFYGLGAFMRNGRKVIKCPNSWGIGWGDKGYLYLDEEYFKSNNVYVPSVLIDQKNILVQDMIETFKLKGHPEIFAKSLTSKKIHWIGGWDSYKLLLDNGWAKPFVEVESLADFEVSSGIMGFLK